MKRSPTYKPGKGTGDVGKATAKEERRKRNICGNKICTTCQAPVGDPDNNKPSGMSMSSLQLERSNRGKLIISTVDRQINWQAIERAIETATDFATLSGYRTQLELLASAG